ncbi:MAG: hypothetical protein H0T84_15015 [Tatlockia sp.]|nr:hypothetical protein [Tatlockia sp.]
MNWKDTHLNSKTCIPKSFYYMTFWVSPFFVYYITHYMIINAKVNFNVVDIIIPSLCTLYLAFLGICNILMILKGSEYVKIIKKAEDYFEIINIYDEQINFNICDVQEIETVKYSIVNIFLSGFAKQLPGLKLLLKNGKKYRITSDMENIDTLKEHLLSIAEN